MLPAANACLTSQPTALKRGSVCPQRSICPTAFHPALSSPDSLWVHIERYLRFNGFTLPIRYHYPEFVSSCGAVEWIESIVR